MRSDQLRLGHRHEGMGDVPIQLAVEAQSERMRQTRQDHELAVRIGQLAVEIQDVRFGGDAVILAAREQDRKSTRLNSSHTVIYTLSLHDALPISDPARSRAGGPDWAAGCRNPGCPLRWRCRHIGRARARSEEHTSELQSHSDLHSFPTRRSSDLRPGKITSWRSGLGSWL